MFFLNLIDRIYHSDHLPVPGEKIEVFLLIKLMASLFLLTKYKASKVFPIVIRGWTRPAKS